LLKNYADNPILVKVRGSAEAPVIRIEYGKQGPSDIIRPK